MNQAKGLTSRLITLLLASVIAVAPAVAQEDDERARRDTRFGHLDIALEPHPKLPAQPVDLRFIRIRTEFQRLDALPPAAHHRDRAIKIEALGLAIPAIADRDHPLAFGRGVRSQPRWDVLLRAPR